MMDLNLDDLDAVFEYIVEYKGKMDGNSPTVRKIAEALEIPRSTVFLLLRELERQQRIRRIANTNAICVPNGKWTWYGEPKHATLVIA